MQTCDLHTLYIQSTVNIHLPYYLNYSYVNITKPLYSLHTLYIQFTYTLHTLYSLHVNLLTLYTLCSLPTTSNSVYIHSTNINLQFTCNFTNTLQTLQFTYTLHSFYIHSTYTTLQFTYTLHSVYIHSTYIILQFTFNFTNTLQTLQFTYTLHSVYIHFTFSLHTLYLHHFTVYM